MTELRVVVPAGIDDPARPSGGNSYDRRICRGLTAAGWQLVEQPVAGDWPWPDPAARAALARTIAAVPDGAVLLVDGLIASGSPALLVPAASRVRLVVLVHLPLGVEPLGVEPAGIEPLGVEPLGVEPAGQSARQVAVRAGERAVLCAARAVLTTSEWSRGWLLEEYRLPPEQVEVAAPGVDAAGLAPGTPAGDQLLCVAAVTPVKGHDLLLAALAGVADLPWHCDWVGSLDRDPEFVTRLRRQAAAAGLADRVRLTGPRTGADLDRGYAEADVLVLASRAETYGMVVTEALARGLPVIAPAVGGLPETVGGTTAGGFRPGLLVPAADPVALAGALRAWLTDAELRQRLRQAARQRRAELAGWDSTTAAIARVLRRVAAQQP
ncbi:MAG: glycosyltransferase family 4 protein [Jatrophihabitantaceae bacterium]